METRFTPRYFVIEQALRERIATMSPGDPMPSDAMLCREFSVSRMTARNAVQRLAQEDLVDRVPGRGTFVAEPPAHRQVDNLLGRLAAAIEGADWRTASLHELLVERRLVLDTGGRPVELTESRYAAGRYGLDVRFSVEPPAPA